MTAFPKPTTYSVKDLSKLPAALAPLTKLPRWVVWKWEWREGKDKDGKWTKPPYQPSNPGRKAENNNPKTWGTFAEAVAMVKSGRADGIGFNLLDSDHGAIDLDKCREPKTEALQPWAQKMVNDAPTDAYVEVTVSGTGLRIIGTTQGEKLHKKPGLFELYRSCERYITVSGLALNGRGDKPLPNIDALLDGLTETKKKERGRPAGGRNKSFWPKNIISLLDIPNGGAGKPCGAYPTRSEAFFGFISLALEKGIDEHDIITELLNEKFAGNAIYEHCIENGGEDHVKRQIERKLNDSEPAASEGAKWPIRVKKGERHLAVARTEKALVAAHRVNPKVCPVYYRGGFLVEPIWRWQKTAEANHNALVTTFVKLNVSRLAYMTAKHAAIYQRYDGRTQKWELVDPPYDVLEQLLGLGHWSFPTVRGIINSPTMRPDGSLLTEAGYDPATQLWYKPAADITLPPIPEHPTEDDARRALAFIKDLLVGFPFLDELSLSVEIAGLMTPVLRGAFDFAPMFLILAPEPGTGKSYLVTVNAMIATGRQPSALVGCENKEEMEKRLSAACFEALPIIHLNNLDFDLESGLLNQVITEPVVGLRQFGKNDQLIPCDCTGTTIYANGNNIRVVGDLVRRTLTCHLDAKTEQPENRRFDFDPVERIKAQRGEYLAAVFTIARAYRAESYPKMQAVPFAGFDGWSKAIRYPLIWLGLPDPYESTKEAREMDPQREGLRVRIDALLKVYGAGDGNEFEFTAVNVFNKYSETTLGLGGKPTPLYPELVMAFASERGPVSPRTIGKQLNKDLGRVMNGYSLTIAMKSAHGHRYKLVGEACNPEMSGAEPKQEPTPEYEYTPATEEDRAFEPPEQVANPRYPGRDYDAYPEREPSRRKSATRKKRA
jgi:hypothetical protein